MRNPIYLLTVIVPFCCAVGYAQTSKPVFEAKTIDSKIIIGYGIAIGDVDGDKLPDILLADKQQVAWYQNPTWKRHVIAENLTSRDNVCIAARDIDGDGKVEVAVGGEWNPGDTVDSGAVHYLIPPEDRTKKWKPVKLHHEPVVHRMRWVRLADKQFALVVAPLHGRNNSGGKGDGVRLLAYHPPQDPTATWKTDLLDDAFHITHNFDVVAGASDQQPENILWYGREGAKLLSYNNGNWDSLLLSNIQGGGEIRYGQMKSGGDFIATIEPFHGTELVHYQLPENTNLEDYKAGTAIRNVLDDNFNQGHGVVTGDFLGVGSDQIVAGWRNPNRDGRVGVNLYYRDATTGQWHSSSVDDNTMACEDLRAADLDGDGRLDIVAAGRSTHNLKIYFNKTTVK